MTERSDPAAIRFRTITLPPTLSRGARMPNPAGGVPDEGTDRRAQRPVGRADVETPWCRA